jgi:hypothetical protein
MSEGSDRRRFSRRRLLAGLGAASFGGIGWTRLRGEYDRSQSGFDPEILPYDETYPDDDGITMFRRGLRRLGYYPDAVVPDAVEVEWSRAVNGNGHTAAQ